MDMVEKLKDLCASLGHYQMTQQSIVTRCIYCGDSQKRLTNHGHFYIWKEHPFAICFRCGRKLTLLQWLYDLANVLPQKQKAHIDDLIKCLMPYFQRHTSNQTSTSPFEDVVNTRTQKKKLNGDESYRHYYGTNSSGVIEVQTENALEHFLHYLESKRKLNTKLFRKLLLTGLLENFVIVRLVADANNSNNQPPYYMGVRGLFSPSYVLRLIDSNNSSDNSNINVTDKKSSGEKDILLAEQRKQHIIIKLLKDELFYFGNILGENIYLCEGIVDALSLMQLLINASREDEATFLLNNAFVVSSVPEHISNVRKILTHYNCDPKQLLVIYDSDVAIKTIRTHKQSINSKKNPILFAQCKLPYKDINHYMQTVYRDDSSSQQTSSNSSGSWSSWREFQSLDFLTYIV